MRVSERYVSWLRERSLRLTALWSSSPCLKTNLTSAQLERNILSWKDRRKIRRLTRRALADSSPDKARPHDPFRSRFPRSLWVVPLGNDGSRTSTAGRCIQCGPGSFPQGNESESEIELSLTHATAHCS